MVKRAINTCGDGTCRTLVAWYAKGGRSNFCAWNGPDRFLMTAVLEEYDDNINREIYKYCGYGSDDPREGGHLVKFVEGDGIVSPTLTTLAGCMGLVVLEEYEED